jgi:SPP1 family predicted phage head-tail adaptor
VFAPKLDRRVSLQRRTLGGATVQGEQVETFTTYATVWAEKLEGGGREAFVASTTYAETTVRFRIRHRTDVLVTDRAEFAGQSFDVIAVSEIGRKEGLELFCRAQAS